MKPYIFTERNGIYIICRRRSRLEGIRLVKWAKPGGNPRRHEAQAQIHQEEALKEDSITSTSAGLEAFTNFVTIRRVTAW